MILVFKPGCDKSDVANAEAHLRELGFEPHTLYGVERTVIAAIGDDRVTTAEHLQSIPGVERCMPILAPYKLASREAHPGGTSELPLGGPGPEVSPTPNKVIIGGKKIAVIAGPCSVEDRS